MAMAHAEAVNPRIASATNCALMPSRLTKPHPMARSYRYLRRPSRAAASIYSGR